MNPSTYANNLNTGVSRSEELYDCRYCDFGLSQPQSCFDLLYACLGKDGVYSASQRTLPELPGKQPFFCRGIYILFIDQKEASCPLHIEVETLLSYSIYQLLRETLTQKYGTDVEVKHLGTELDKSSRTLEVSSKLPDGPITVEVRANIKEARVIKEAIKEALDIGDIHHIHGKDIDWEETIDDLDCEDGKSGWKICDVNLKFKGANR